jgi:hypothetical protein
MPENDIVKTETCWDNYELKLGLGTHILIECIVMIKINNFI